MPGNDTNHQQNNSDSTTEDAFGLVGNEIRAEILRVLGDAGHGGDTELPLSELRSRMDTDVTPSQLHYHLRKLVGDLITKTNGGYRLHIRGYRLYSTLRAGVFDHRQEHLSVSANFNCYHCQAPVEAIFTDGRVRITCSHCDYLYMNDYDDLQFQAFEDEAVAFSHFSKYILLRNFFLACGICPSCSHPVTPELKTNEDIPEPRKVFVSQSCDLCGSGWTQTIGMALLADYDLRMFCAEHGVDIVSTPWWELEFAATDKHVTVYSTDPWEVALEVTFDCDSLELIVDSELNIVERNRIDATDDGGTSSGRSATSSDTPTRSRERGKTVDLPTTLACVQSIRHHRWPDGVACPRCDSPDTIKKGTTGKGAQRYRCQYCNRSFTDLTGTIFADRRLTLPEMFHIIREMDEKNPTQIAQPLERSYRSVLDFVQEVQDAPGEDAGVDLSTVCETDDISGAADDTGVSQEGRRD